MYSVGIDVGQRSLGLAAIQMDPAGQPVKLLNCQTWIHDAGLDPHQQKIASTRLAQAGLARRVRRMRKSLKQRLASLDSFITDNGWPIVDLAEERDPYLPWRARAALAEAPVLDLAERDRLLSIALRHIARHRGWRNPYLRAETLFEADHPSSDLVDLWKKVTNTQEEPAAESTLAQIVCLHGLQSSRLRSSSKRPGLLAARPLQTDMAWEISRWCEVQGISEELRRKIIRVVFQAKSPRGSAAERVGKDALPGQADKPRALRASLSFQRFRMIAILMNLRVAGNGSQRRLTADEISRAEDFLSTATSDPTWGDLAEVLGLTRAELRGTAKETADGDRSPSRPPTMATNRVIAACKVAPLKKWWQSPQPPESREELIAFLCNAIDETNLTNVSESVVGLLTSLSDEDLGKLDSISLPIGRAAYSQDSLARLTERMLTDACDLTAARTAEFNVPDDWTPSAEEVGAPVGNPAVDRILKEVARYLASLHRQFGAPATINIEHVRSGLVSESQARELERANTKRYQDNLKTQQTLAKELGTSERIYNADVLRHQAVQRQNCQCAYCGKPITVATADMDHIVPRSGPGSSNTRVNLLAACRPCNQSKSNLPFHTWASGPQSPNDVTVQGATERVRMWARDAGYSPADFRRLQQEVVARLNRTDLDPEIDARSLESVAWMARELRHRVEQAYLGTDVRVFRGQLTAEARKAAGIERRLPFIGGPGKTRFDRRHHAVDAAVVALLRPAVAKTLKERIDLREEEYLSKRPTDWKKHLGSSPAIYLAWLDNCSTLGDLLGQALTKDQIPVRRSLRLSLGNSKAHDDTIQRFQRVPLTGAMDVSTILRASSPQLWTALTRLPDYSPKDGLPENPSRRIRVNHDYLQPGDEITLFRTGAAAIAVRGGYAEIGSTIHHVRIYRLGGKTPTFGMVRVFASDLVRHSSEDLFDVPLAHSSISLRTSAPKVREALGSGTAEYLGWLVVDDELDLQVPGVGTDAYGRFQQLLPTTRWSIVGFSEPTRITLRPAQLAGEGLDGAINPVLKEEPAVKELIAGKGWRPTPNKLFSTHRPVIVRRDAMGIPRWQSAAHLPISWKP